MRHLASAVIACVLVLAGCSPSTPAPAPAPQNGHQSTFRWIANPAVDLTSPEGTFIRGVAESWVLAFAQSGKGIDALRAAGYPGFEHAFNNAWDPKGWAGNGYFGIGRVGTDYFEVIDLRRDGPNFSATVCNYSSMTAQRQEDGQYGGVGSGSGLVATLTFGPDPALAANAQRTPPSHQAGPARAPGDDVFGTWITTEWHGFKGLEPRCDKLAPGTPPDAPSDFVRPDAPPTLSPEPGWPEGSSA